MPLSDTMICGDTAVKAARMKSRRKLSPNDCSDFKTLMLYGRGQSYRYNKFNQRI